MLHALRRLPLLALTLVAVTACDDDPTPTTVIGGLPDALAPLAVTTAKNTPVERFVSVSNTGGRTFTASVLSGPQNGSIEVTAVATGVNVRYTPNTGFAGTDQLTYRVDDGVTSVDGVVNITVTNAIPTAETVFLRRPALSPVTVQVSGTDPDGDPLSFEVVDAPANGSLSAFAAGSPAAGPQATSNPSFGQVTYTPDEGFLGDESFTYRVNDGTDVSPAATVFLTANRLPQAMIEGGASFGVARNTPTLVSVALSDIDGDDVAVSLVTGPGNGTLGALETTAAGVDVLFTPTPGFAGDDSFTLLLDDGLDQVEFVVSLSVINTAPVAFNVTVAGVVGNAVVVDLTGSDPDGDPLTFEIVSGPAIGSLGTLTSTGPNTAQVVYTPGAAPAGDQSFTFRVGDGGTFSQPATATVALSSGAPIARAQSVTVDEDSSVDIILRGIDQQGDQLTFSVVTPPAHGSLGAITSLGLYTAQVTYTPTVNFNGADFFTFSVSDGSLSSNVAQVSITVVPDPDDPPIVVGSPVETFTTHTNVPLQVAAARSADPAVFVTGDLLSNFIDLDFDGLTASLVPASVTAGASVTVNPDGTFIYAPPAGRTADDTFDYTVTDGMTPVTRTVTVQFTGTAWFVDDTFGGASDGTPAAPFVSLAAAAAGSGPNDIVFVYAGNSGVTPLPGGFAFQAAQQLVGEPAGLTTGLGPVVAASAAARPVLTNAGGAGVTLADGAVLSGIDVDATSGAGLAATGVAGATVSSVTITNAGGAGIDLDAPTGTWAFNSVTVSGSAAGALDIDGGSAMITGDPSLTSAAGRSVEISAVTGGSVTLSGPIADTGLGIQIDNNTGGVFTLSGASKVVNTGASPAVTLSNNTGATVAFTGGGLDIDVTSAAGFSATGGGTVTVEGAANSVTATTGTPITVQNTTIGAGGATFESVAADGAANGIVVDATGAGPFSITGVGTTDGSGGTITNTTGDAVVLNATGSVSLANMVLGDPTAVLGQIPDATNFVGGAGIMATDVSGTPGLALSNVLVSRTASHGIDGTRVTGLSVTGSDFLNNGDGAGDDAMRFGTLGVADGLFGTVTIANTVLDGFVGNGLLVENETGALSMTVSALTASNNQAGVASGIGADGIRLNPGGTATLVVDVSGASTFSTIRGSGIFANPQAGSALDLTVNGNTFDDTDTGAGAATVIPQDLAVARVRMTNNTVLDAFGFGLYLESAGSSDLDGRVDANTIGDGTFGSGTGSNGIAVIHASTGTSRFLVENNVLTSHGGSGIFAYNEETGVAADIDSHATVRNNSVSAPESIATPGIEMLTFFDVTLCADVTGNTSAGSAGASGIEVQQNGASVFQVLGLGALAVDVYLAGANTSTAASTGGTYVDAPAACLAPTPPSVP
ncbi:MAG: tandem-95 repeat protein [Gemmatimonadetes bacterium]|nr:tandem-95 repeat protein [Gemmatimonadota bacterium]